MSENVELIREAVEAFNRDDYEAWIGTFTECEFWPLRAQLDGRPYQGTAGLRRFVREMEEDWEQSRFRVNEFREGGDTVVGLARFQATGRRSRVEIDVPVGLVIRFTDGSPVYTRFYSDQNEALKAAALSE
jgi:ketosteroid isomerase-like protein